MGILKNLYNRILRPLLPWKIGVANGVAVRRHKLLDRQTVDHDLESTPVTALQSIVRPGDHVVIVGGGHGITACWAARKCGPNGHVDVFEAFEDTANHVRETVELNGLADRVAVHVEIVDAGTELPECDVLEIDCEGCEVDIIPCLDIEPRALVVEHHARFQRGDES